MALPLKQSGLRPRRESGPAGLLSIGFSTAFAKDARGVSVLQHPSNIWTERHGGAWVSRKFLFRARACDVYYLTSC
jgi:hypothetical protein